MTRLELEEKMTDLMQGYLRDNPEECELLFEAHCVAGVVGGALLVSVDLEFFD